MDEIARKNDNFMVNRDKRNQRLQNREVRGESPIRKSSTLPNQPNSFNNSGSFTNAPKLSNQSSITNANNSIPSTPANKIYPIPNKLSQNSQQQQLQQLSNQSRNPSMPVNNTNNNSNINNIETSSTHSFQMLSKKIERSNSNSHLKNGMPSYFQHLVSSTISWVCVFVCIAHTNFFFLLIGWLAFIHT